MKRLGERGLGIARLTRTVPRGAERIVIRRARELLPPGNPFGIFAFGIGRKRVRGLPRPARALIVYVLRKEASPRNAVPPVRFRFHGQRYELLPDVVATGRPARAHEGSSVLFTGLHPGAQIIVELGTARSHGAVTCLLTSDGSPKYLVTAGHAFPPSAEGTTVVAGSYETQEPVHIGELRLNLLDGPMPGLPNGLDAALVELSQEGADLALSTAADPRMPRFSRAVPLLKAQGVLTQAYLSVAHEYSRPVTAKHSLFTGYMDSEVRPGPYRVDDVLQTDIEITQPGDSGTALFLQTEPTAAVGGCVGGLPGVSSLFEPAARTLRILRRELGEPLQFWPQTG